MALARVVSFDDVDAARMDEMRKEMEAGGPPQDLPATEVIVLHDRDENRSLVVFFFEDEESYAKGDATLNAMSTDETPGRRSSVSRYDVAVRMNA
jgi:hypothetical protein